MDSFDLSLWVSFWFIFEWILRIAALFFVPRNRSPSSGISWLFFIFLLPLIGIFFYLLIGNPKLPLIRRKSQEVVTQYAALALREAKFTHPDQKKILDSEVEPQYQRAATLTKELTGLPVFGDTSVQFLTDYLGIIDHIINDVHRSKHYVYVEFFALALDDTTEPLFDAMRAAVERGVVVRVLFDHIGSRKYPGYRKMKRRLRDDGIEFYPMLPLRFPGRGYVRPDLRNHRKLVVIDNHTAYTGSLNMIERAYHRKDAIVYDELMAKIHGLVVLQLKSVFMADWFAETNTLLRDDVVDVATAPIKDKGSIKAQALPSGPGYAFENNLKVFVQLFHSAKQSITIVNPYFVPPEPLILAMTSAAQRGVKVTLVNSEAVDQAMVAHAQSSYYEQMLDAGVEIFRYKAPTLLHSKYILIDDVALVGTSNVDIRSFELNHELTVIFYSTVVTKRLRAITNEYLKRAKQLKASTWRKRSAGKRLLDNLARLTSSLQ